MEANANTLRWPQGRRPNTFIEVTKVSGVLEESCEMWNLELPRAGLIRLQISCLNKTSGFVVAPPDGCCLSACCDVFGVFIGQYSHSHRNIPPIHQHRAPSCHRYRRSLVPADPEALERHRWPQVILTVKRVHLGRPWHTEVNISLKRELTKGNNQRFTDLDRLRARG